MSTNKKFRIQNGVDITGEVVVGNQLVITAEGKLVLPAITDAVSDAVATDIAALQAQVDAILGTSPEHLDTLQEIVALFQSEDGDLQTLITNNSTAIADLQAQVGAISISEGSTDIKMEAQVDMDGNKITNMAAPTDASDATTKDYVDTAIANADVDLSDYSTTAEMNTAIANAEVDLSDYSTTAEMNTAIAAEVSNVVDAAPAALDTLNELAAALGDDANFASTVTTSLADTATAAQGALADTAVQPEDFGDGFGTKTAISVDPTSVTETARLTSGNSTDYLHTATDGTYVISWNNNGTGGGGPSGAGIQIHLASDNSYVSDIQTDLNYLHSLHASDGILVVAQANYNNWQGKVVAYDIVTGNMLWTKLGAASNHYYGRMVRVGSTAVAIHSMPDGYSNAAGRLEIFDLSGNLLHTIDGTEYYEKLGLGLAINSTYFAYNRGVAEHYQNTQQVVIREISSGNVVATIDNPNGGSNGFWAAMNNDDNQMDMSETNLVIGSSGKQTYVDGVLYKGAAFVYDFTGTLLNTFADVVSSVDNGTFFGTGVATEGDLVYVGAHSERHQYTGLNADRIEIFSISENAHKNTINFVNGDTEGTEFGREFFVSGSVLAAGATNKSNNSENGSLFTVFNFASSTQTSFVVDDSVFATKDYVDSGVAGVDLSAYSTTAEMDSAIAAIPATDLTPYSTTAEMNAAIATSETDAKAYADQVVAATVDAAPAALDTLNELAAALGDDANFASTVTTSLATKADDADLTALEAQLADIKVGTAEFTVAGDILAGQPVSLLPSGKVALPGSTVEQFIETTTDSIPANKGGNYIIPLKNVREDTYVWSYKDLNSDTVKVVVVSFDGTNIVWSSPSVVPGINISGAEPLGLEYHPSSNRGVVIVRNGWQSASCIAVQFVVNGDNSITFGTSHGLSNSSRIQSEVETASTVEGNIVIVYGRSSNYGGGASLSTIDANGNFKEEDFTTEISVTEKYGGLVYNVADDLFYWVYKHNSSTKFVTFWTGGGAPTFGDVVTISNDNQTRVEGVTFNPNNNKTTLLVNASGQGQFSIKTISYGSSGMTLWTNIPVSHGGIPSFASTKMWVNDDSDSISVAVEGGGYKTYQENNTNPVSSYTPNTLPSSDYDNLGEIYHLIGIADNGAIFGTYFWPSNFYSSYPHLDKYEHAFVNSILTSSLESFVGFSNVSDTTDTGNTIEVTIAGGLSADHNNLNVGSAYYLQDDGTIGTTVTSIKVGVALSATTLLVSDNLNDALTDLSQYATKDYVDSGVAGVDLSAYSTTTEMDSAIAVETAARTAAIAAIPATDLTPYSTTAEMNAAIATSETDAKAYADQVVAATVDAAPAALDTLNELAAALGDDANFASTVTASIATKADDAATTAALDSKVGLSEVETVMQPVKVLAESALQPENFGDSIARTITTVTDFSAEPASPSSEISGTVLSNWPGLSADNLYGAVYLGSWEHVLSDRTLNIFSSGRSSGIDSNYHDATSKVFITDSEMNLVEKPESSVGSRYGENVSFNDDYMVVSAHGSENKDARDINGNSLDGVTGGAVHVYNAHEQYTISGLSILKGNDYTGDYKNNWDASTFGDNVVLVDGTNTAIISDSRARDINGHAEGGRVLHIDLEDGSIVKEFTNPSYASQGRFGISVKVSGDTVFIGAGYDNTDGSIHQFSVSTGSLIRSYQDPYPEDLSSDSQTGGFYKSRFSENFEVFGNYLLVSQSWYGQNVYVFDHTTGSLVSSHRDPISGTHDTSYGYNLVSKITDNLVAFANAENPYNLGDNHTWNVHEISDSGVFSPFALWSKEGYSSLKPSSNGTIVTTKSIGGHTGSSGTVQVWEGVPSTTTSYDVDDSVFASKTYVDNAVANADPDLSSYPTTAEMDSAIAAIPATDLTPYSTTAQMDSSIATAKSEAQSYADQVVAATVDAAPAALDTLNELAAALGDDANFASTVTASIATKADDAATTAALATKADKVLAESAIQPEDFGDSISKITSTTVDVSSYTPYDVVGTYDWVEGSKGGGFSSDKVAILDFHSNGDFNTMYLYNRADGSSAGQWAGSGSSMSPAFSGMSGNTFKTRFKVSDDGFFIVGNPSNGGNIWYGRLDDTWLNSSSGASGLGTTVAISDNVLAWKAMDTSDNNKPNNGRISVQPRSAGTHQTNGANNYSIDGGSSNEYIGMYMEAAGTYLVYSSGAPVSKYVVVSAADGSAVSEISNPGDSNWGYGMNTDGTNVVVLSNDNVYVYTMAGSLVTSFAHNLGGLPDGVDVNDDAVLVAYGSTINQFSISSGTLTGTKTLSGHNTFVQVVLDGTDLLVTTDLGVNYGYLSGSTSTSYDVNDSVFATKAYADQAAAGVDLSAYSTTAEMNSAIGVETSRATGVENSLQSQISNILSNTDATALNSLAEIVAEFQSADVTLTSSVAGHGTRLTAIESWNTDNLPEGDNKFFTDERVKTALTGGLCINDTKLQATGEIAVDEVEAEQSLRVAEAVVSDDTVKLEGQGGSHYRIDIYDVNGTIVN